MHVESWFDEVMEREALNSLVRPPKPEEPVTDDSTEFKAKTATAHFAPQSRTGSLVPAKRLAVLRRHGRSMAGNLGWNGMSRQLGWDGSPLELQPLYETHNYLTVAHYFGNHQASTPTVGESQAWHTCAGKKNIVLSRTETMAKELLQMQDFRHETCHQMLDALDLGKPRRQCQVPEDGDSGSLVLGLYSYGSMSGITKVTKPHRHLCRYVMKYLKHHGLSDNQITSLQISKNVRAQAHKDVNNARNSLNWHMTLGRYQGGRLWVECGSAEPPREAEWKKVNGKQVPGLWHDSRHKLLAFRPGALHETEPFEGSRFAITAYTSRSLDQADVSTRSKLRRLGFLSRLSSTFEAYFVEEDQLHEGMEWLRESLHEAYPTRTWQTPGEGETAVMDTTGDEGDDGSHEPSRARKQALKKELPWRSMSKEEIPAFVQAVVDEWSEWTRWSSCRPVYCDVSKIDPRLILKSRVCYRWKPKNDGTYKAKARVVVAGFRDPHLPLLSRDSRAEPGLVDVPTAMVGFNGHAVVVRRL